MDLADLEEIEDLERLKRKDNPFPRPPQHGAMHEVHEQRYPALSPRETVIMGPNPIPSTVFRCYIHHSDNRCTCEPPEIKSQPMFETCNSSVMFLLGVLRKKPESGKLAQKDLDFLAWATSKVTGHWGRLALGQEDLI